MHIALPTTARRALVTFALLALGACGGGGGGGGPMAPSALSYPSPTAVTVNTALAALSPTVTGTVTSYAVAPALPMGLSLNTQTGVISGTPTVVTAAASYTVTATNSAGSTPFALTLAVTPVAPSALSYTSPLQAAVGTAITALSPTVTGTIDAYSVTPALPAGLALDAASGLISGTPTTPTAQATYTVKASNAGGNTTFGVVITVSAVPTVSGVAAAGAPISGATITLKDAAGHSVAATTAADGTFAIDVTGLTPPFLLSVAGAGTTLYGYAASTGTANVTPYTTVPLQAYYTAQGSTIGATFAGSLSASSFPSGPQLTLLLQPFVSALQPYLSNAGVAQPQTFNPFTIPFTANHTGFDIVLDRTTLSAGALSITVDNGSGGTAGNLSSTTTVAVTPGSGAALATVSVSTQTSNSTTSTSTTSQQTVPVGTSGAQQTALADAENGILAMFASLAQVVASKGSAIAASDLAPFIDANYLDQGNNGAALASRFVANFANVPAGTTLTVSIQRINRFDATNGIVDATVEITFSNGATTAIGYLMSFDSPGYGDVYRQQAGGSWAFYGQQTAYTAHASVEARRFYDANSGTPDLASTSLTLGTQVSVTPAALSAASVSGPSNSLPNCALNPPPLTQSTVTLAKDAGLFNGQERYDLPCSSALVAAPTAGAVYTFNLTRTSDGAIVQQTYPLNGSTTDNGDMTQINGASRAAFAASHAVASVAGTTLTVAFTPPSTFPLLYSFVNGFCQNAAQKAGGGGNDIQGAVGDLPPGTNSGTIAVPAQCSGAPTAVFNVDVHFVGVNGELASVGQNLLY